MAERQSYARCQPADGRLRVTVVSLAEEIWGSETSILGVAPYLADRGVDLTLAAPAHGAFARAASARGVAVRDLRLPAHQGVVGVHPSVRASARNAMRELPRVGRGVRAVARATAGADVVHSNSLLANVDCVIAGRVHRRPTVLEIHDLVRPGLSRQLLSAALRAADAGVAVSTPVAANVERWAARRVRHIAQAVDTGVFSPAPADPRVRRELSASPAEPLIAIVGRVDPVKNVDRVIAAVADLNRTGLPCRLVVVGRASQGHQAYADGVRLAAAQSLGDRVRFVGTRKDVASVLRAVDLLVNASSVEPFGLSALEAQACGVPVVAADTGGLPDFVIEGVTGRLFDLSTPGALADALATALRSPARTSAMARAARCRLEQFHSLPARADALDRLYRGLARRKAVFA